MSLRTAIIERLDDIGRDAWNSVVSRCPDSTVFQRYEWIDSWLRTVGKDCARPCIVAAYRGHDLVGVAPMWHGADPGDPADRRAVRFLGAWHSDYLTFPAVEASRAVLDALLECLNSALPPGEPVELLEIPDGSALAACLAERSAQPASAILAGDRTPCPRLRIAGNESQVSRILGKESVRRRQNKLRRLGQLDIEHLADPDLIAPLLEGFFEQHVRRWAATPFPSLFRHPYNRSFYREVLQTLGKDSRVLFTVVRVSGHPVAQHFGLCSGKDLLWYKPAFDTAFSRSSPGDVLLSSLIEHARAAGFAALDFTRGSELFKSRFASEVRFNCSYTWYRGAWSRTLARVERAARGQVRKIRAALRRAR